MIVRTGTDWVTLNEDLHNTFQVLNTSNPNYATAVVKAIASLGTVNWEHDDAYTFTKSRFGYYFPYFEVYRGNELGSTKAAPVPNDGQGPQRFDKGDKRGGQFQPKNDQSFQPVTPEQQMQGIQQRLSQHIESYYAAKGPMTDDEKKNATQMYLDVMSLDKEGFQHYGSRLGIPEEELTQLSDQFFKTQREVTRSQAQARWDFERSNTLTRNGKPIDMAYTAATQKIDDALQKGTFKLPKNVDAAVNAVRKHNPNVKVVIEDQADDGKVTRDMAVLDKVLIAHPAGAKVFKEKCKRIVYSDDASGGSQNMSWENNTGTLRIWHASDPKALLLSSMFLHELGHGAEDYLTDSSANKIFGEKWDDPKHNRVSSYAWGNSSEAFAEYFVIAQDETARKELDDFAPDMVDKLDKALPWVRWTGDQWNKQKGQAQ